MVVKTFRDMLADGGQHRIRLSTIKGKVGYKIVKFELYPETPGNASQESSMKIFKSQQTTITGLVDFSDSDILAAGMFKQGSGADASATAMATIFDNEIFNQDIYITHVDNAIGVPCNYYLELEVIPLDDAGAEYTTLKDMRQT